MKAMWNNPIWLSNLAECVPSPLVPRYVYEILWRYHRSIGEIGPQIGETGNLFLSPLPSIPKVRRLAEASAEGCHRKFSKGNTGTPNNFKNMFLNHPNINSNIKAILPAHSYWQKIVPIVWPPHQLTPRAARPGFLKTCNFVRKTLSDSGVIIRNSCMTMLVTLLRLTAFHLSSWLEYSNALGFYVRSTWQLSTISFGLSIRTNTSHYFFLVGKWHQGFIPPLSSRFVTWMDSTSLHLARSRARSAQASRPEKQLQVNGWMAAGMDESVKGRKESIYLFVQMYNVLMSASIHLCM